jgi:hypothetical protein
MAVTMISKKARNTSPEVAIPEDKSGEWVRWAAGASLIAGGCLLLTGRRRAGMVVAASGTAMALLDQQDTVRQWWGTLPHYVDRAQLLAEKAQEVIRGVTEKADTVRRTLARNSK